MRRSARRSHPRWLRRRLCRRRCRRRLRRPPRRPPRRRRPRRRSAACCRRPRSCRRFSAARSPLHRRRPRRRRPRRRRPRRRRRRRLRRRRSSTAAEEGSIGASGGACCPRAETPAGFGDRCRSGKVRHADLSRSRDRELASRTTLMRLRLHELFLTLGTVLVVLTAALLLSIAFQQQSSRSAEEWTRHSYDVLEQSERLVRDVAVCESAVRGYALSGTSEALAPYEQTASSVAVAAALLTSSVGDNPQQVRRARAVQQRVEKRMQHLAAIVRLVDSGRRQVAIAAATGAEDARAARALTADAAAFEEAELRLRVSRGIDAAERHRSVLQTLVVGALVTCSVLLGLGALIGRSTWHAWRRWSGSRKRLPRERSSLPLVPVATKSPSWIGLFARWRRACASAASRLHAIACSRSGRTTRSSSCAVATGASSNAMHRPARRTAMRAKRSSGGR